MTEVAIYVEGGGDSNQQKTELRQGFNSLMEQQLSKARAKRPRWNVVFAGGRKAAYDAFIHKLRVAGPEVLCVLLVDSEDRLDPESPEPRDESPEGRLNRLAVDAVARRDHLIRQDDWKLLYQASPEHVHLMVQCMETWIVADPEALADYYKQGFQASTLPSRHELEEEPKTDVYRKLRAATERTQKGAYTKIKHASELLRRVDPQKIMTRCPRFRTLVRWLDDQLDNA